MTTELQAVTVTALTYPALFNAISRWVAAQSSTVAVTSVTAVPVPGEDAMTAPVVFTDSDVQVRHVPVRPIGVHAKDDQQAAASAIKRLDGQPAAKSYRPEAEKYFQDRIGAGVDPATITGTDVARNTGAAESIARNILADLKRNYQQSQDDQ